MLGASGCDIRLFRYREGLFAAAKAYQLATISGNVILAGAAFGNKATIYYQLGQYDAAHDSIVVAIASFGKSDIGPYLAQALSLAGDIESKRHDLASSVSLFERSIEVAHNAKLITIEGVAKHHLGGVLLETGDIIGAENALMDALRIFKKTGDSEYLIDAKGDIAELYLRKKDLRKALVLINEVLAVHTTNTPRCWPLQTKARVLLALGKPTEAILVLNEAVAWANKWRIGILLADDSEIKTSTSLFSIYDDYVEAAASLAVQNYDSDLASRVFSVLSSSRAWCIRNSFLLGLHRTMMLPSEYYKLLSEFQKTLSKIDLDDAKHLPLLRSHLLEISSDLTNMENKFGADIAPLPNERSIQHNFTRRVQIRLDKDELLLCFYTGNTYSFLWVVSREDFHLYMLPDSRHILDLAEKFSINTRDDAFPGLKQSITGHRLSAMLFGQISSKFTSKHHWIIDANGLLESVPLLALPVVIDGSKTLRFIPSAALILINPLSEKHDTFIGVADPIYNAIDSRLLNGTHIANHSSLSRLIGTAREILISADSSRLPNRRILTGSVASVQELRNAISKSSPAIIHFSVHVIAEKSAPGYAALALSLTQDGRPELLTKEMIATLHVPGSLIVMNGCSSQRGEVLSSAGVIGLSRSWLIAGASAVVVTNWPIQDGESDVFFRYFYNAFQNTLGNISKRAAVALELSDIATRKIYNPSMWASYSLVSRN
jgi:tetratricopeptide (TPR) repeat protein